MEKTATVEKKTLDRVIDSPRMSTTPTLERVSGDYLAREIQERLYKTRVDPSTYVNPEAE